MFFQYKRVSSASIDIKPTTYERVRRIRPKKSNVRYKFMTLELKILNQSSVTFVISLGNTTRLLFRGNFIKVYI